MCANGKLIDILIRIFAVIRSARRCAGAILLCGTMVWITAAGTATADTSYTLTHQEIERRYELHLPPDPAAPTPKALVVSLHGKGQSIEGIRRWLRFEPVADREGFAIAYPEALDGRWSYGRPTVDPMPRVGDRPADDVGFIAAIITELVSQGIADADRVYVAGASRGGLMTFTIACALSEQIAAAAPLITGMTDLQRDDCRPALPVPLLVLAGTSDFVQRYDGWLLRHGRLLSVPETMEYWRNLHGRTGQKSAPLPHLNPFDRTGVGVVRWTGCRSNDEPLRLYRIFGGGHTLPSLAPAKPGPPGKFGRRNRDIETAEVLWAFFRDRRLAR